MSTPNLRSHQLYPVPIGAPIMRCAVPTCERSAVRVPDGSGGIVAVDYDGNHEGDTFPTKNRPVFECHADLCPLRREIDALAEAGKLGATGSRCAGCDAPIKWHKTPADQFTPQNLDGSPHWATCPNAGEFRRRTALREPQATGKNHD